MNGGPPSISHALGRGHVTLKKDLCLPDAGLLCALRSLLCSCLTILQGYVCRYHKQHTKYIEYHKEYQTVSGDTIVKSLAKEINFRKLFKNLAIKEG